MIRCVAAACAAVLVLGSPAVARAEVNDYAGKPVRAFTVVSEGRSLVDPKLLGLVETPVGEPLRIVQVRESIAHLFSLGRFEDVRVHAELRGDGVALTYELQPLRTIGGLSFENATAPGIDRGQLRRIVAERFGAVPQAGRVGDIARVLEEQLRLVGYLHGVVAGRADAAADRSTLIFTFAPGERSRVAAIEVQGDTGMPAPEFLKQLGLSAGVPFQRETLNSRIDRYIEQRRARGYYSVRVSLVPRFADEDRTVNLTIAVTPGPRTRIELKGDALPADRRDELVPIAREGSTDEDLLEDSSNRIQSYLRAQGYRDAAAPHSIEETGGEQVIIFAVKKGPQYRVGQIDIAGNASIPLASLQARLRVRAGQPFSAAALESDLAVLEDLYHREGFASVEAEMTTTVAPLSLDAVDVSIGVKIAITENVRTVVSAVTFEGNPSLSEAELRGDLGLQPGRPFFVTQMALDRDAIELHYANQGFPATVVTGSPRVSADGTEAVVAFTVHEGQRVFVDHVLIVGNERIKDATILNELQFKPGDPLGLAAVNESQRRLTALGLFRRARIAALEHGDATRRDMLVTVEEAPLTTVGYGGGFEVRPALSDEDRTVAAQRLEFAPRASFEIGRRNLFGRNRSINLFTSASLVPDKPSADGTTASGDGYGFPEYRLLGQFREPRIAGTAVDFRVTGTLEQQSRTSFDFARRSASAEFAGRIARNVSLSGGYQIQRSSVFNQTVDAAEQRTIDRILPKVRLSFFSSSIIRDTRDDPVNPGAGRYLSANAELAARRIGSEVGFAKSFFTVQAFHTLPGRRRIVLATAGRLGLATAFPGTNVGEGEGDLPASERFYAGGDTTVRGFALDQLGVRHSPPLPSDTLDSANFPLGGNGLVILNGELRVPLRGSLGLVGFMDAGNVFKSAGDIDVSELRAAVGFGVRYRSPVGPIRVDLGFKLRRQDLGASGREALTALHISLGQAF